MVKGFRHLAKAILVSVLVTSCASMGNPGGGPKDLTPPVFMGSTPTPGELNFNKKKIESFVSVYIGTNAIKVLQIKIIVVKLI